ncbi:hypothetical protein AALP_AA2G110800 [Arabis alpina]|uniref:Uncharacterized protein n=1 Tax=Arabis alpina TaxID=50452 RepID=A0A087HGN8_ARAAL|nr:hypothetical protein AALP_AA2G110800 [Arabis alpina]
MVMFGLCALVSLSHSSMRFSYFVDEKNIELPSLCCLTCVRIDYAPIACTIRPREAGSRLLPIASLRNSTAVCRLSPGLSLTLTIAFLGIVEEELASLFLLHIILVLWTHIALLTLLWRLFTPNPSLLL